MVSSQALKLGLSLGSTAVLARLLTPEDFGLVAMTTPLLTLADSVSNLGLETAIVQRKHLTHEQTSEIFWLSQCVNTVLMTGLVALTPGFAWIFREERVIGIGLVISVGITARCLSFQQRALLKRQMQFGVLSSIELGSLLVGTGVALGSAFQGWGYWALILQGVVVELVQCVLYWRSCPWRPSPPKKLLRPSSELRSLLRYSLPLTGHRCLTRLGMYLDRLCIGYMGGPQVLGLYQTAYRWAYFPFEQIFFTFFDVAVSSFSRVQEDIERYRSYFRYGLMPIFGISMPALAFLYVKAQSVILILLGDQWAEVVPIFRLLLVAVFIASTYRVTKLIYISEGQTQRQLRWGIAYTLCMVSIVAFGAQWGIKGISISYVTGITLLTVPGILYCLQISPLGWTDLLFSLWRSALASVASAIFLLSVYQPVFSPEDSELLSELTLELGWFSMSYVILWCALPGGLNDINQLYRSLGVSLKNKEANG